jgi:hypothetical protein
MTQEKSTSWIDRVMERMPASQGGDTIIGNIGSARNAAIGKNIVQVADILGKPQSGDVEEVAKAVERLRAEFQELAPRLSEGKRYVAVDKIDMIEQELTKKDGSPSGDLIRAAGDWLIDNIPEIGSPLLSIFLPEPAGRILASAGAATIEWVKSLRDRIVS